MKYYLHSTGLFLASVSVTLVAIFAAGWIIIRAAGIESDFALFLLLMPVFFVSFLGSMRLYAKHLHLSCPDCGKKLKMHYGPAHQYFTTAMNVITHIKLSSRLASKTGPELVLPVHFS